MKWYEYGEAERIKKVYSRFSIKDFWDWWSGKENKIMEVRIKDKVLIKETAKKFNLKWSHSGVYVWNDVLLKQVIAYVREKATVWFGIQPRKKNWNMFGTKSFGGKDVNVEEIGFLFIDIDRVAKAGVATDNDLKNADIMANYILERFSQEKWNNSYIKICSGHGLQLVIKLDFPIKMPNPQFDSKSKTFDHNVEYEKLKQILRKGIGSQIVRFGKRYKDELGVEIDKSCFNLSRVGALPVTKNFKYNTFRWRAIVEMGDKPNHGLSDYVLSKEEDIKTYASKNVFSTSSLKRKNRLRKGKLKNNKLIKFMLEEKLPYGMINNYLWFQLKCLIRDSKIDLQSDEYRKIHRLLEQKVKGSLSSNMPDKKFKFDENIVNSFCIQNLIPPLYDYLPNRTNKLNYNIDNLQWELIYINSPMKLDGDTTIEEDMEKTKKLLRPNQYVNKDILGNFMVGMLEKYGEEKTKFYYEYVFTKYFGFA